MILGKQINIIKDEQSLVAGTVTEVGLNYYVVTEESGKKYHIHNADVPPIYRTWMDDEYSYRAVDQDGHIFYYSKKPVFVNGTWMNIGGTMRPAGRYSSSWARANCANSLQSKDEFQQLQNTNK